MSTSRDRIWIVRTYRVGQTGEKIKYSIPASIQKNKEQVRRHVNREEKKRSASIRGVARIVNANYYRRDGYLIGLDYSDHAYESLRSGGDDGISEQEKEDHIWDAADKQADLWLRRVRRECQKQGILFKYFKVTSDRNENGEPVRVHHHIIVNPEAVNACVKKWRHGGVNYKQLLDEPDHNALVEYLLRQVRHEKHEKRYTPSRNLVHPQPKDRVVRSDAEVQVPRGGSLIIRDEHRKGAPQYIRYTMPDWVPEELENRREAVRIE